MTKTQKTVAAKIEKAKTAGLKFVEVEGMRECMAAQALVKAGFAAEYVRLSEMSGGDYYIHPFSRRPMLTKQKFLAAGRIVL